MALKSCSISISFKTISANHQNNWILYAFLGRLPKVDLIILEGENVRRRPSVRPSTKKCLRFE